MESLLSCARSYIFVRLHDLEAVVGDALHGISVSGVLGQHLQQRTQTRQGLVGLTNGRS